MKHDDILKGLVDDLFCVHAQPTKEQVYEWLINKQYKIAGAYENDCHKQDVIEELEGRDYKIEAIPQAIIDDIVWEFCDRLGDFGNEYGWRTIMNETIEDFEEDLEPYKVAE